jgi:hypothetical protein
METTDKLKLDAQVEDKIVYCFSQWLEAGKSAVLGVPEPAVGDSVLDWTVSLLGNLAWAATVFFDAPMIAGVAIVGASRATKVTSMLGAAVGSGVVGKLRHLGEVADGKLNSPAGKRILHEILGSQVPGLQKVFVEESTEWSRTDLPDRLIAECQTQGVLTENADNNQQLLAFYQNRRPVFDNMVRKIIWENYVFPNPELTFDRGQAGLEDMLSDELQDMVEDFDDQWRDYVSAHLYIFAMSMPNAVKQIYLSRDPFNPTLKFKRIPEKLQHIGDANKAKLLRLVHAQD